MSLQFRNRHEAGQQLARRLMNYARRPDVLVLALPRGGVPVGYEVARALKAPLDIFVVRKLGTPGQEELAMGAIASGGVRVLNGEVVEGLGITDTVIESVAARESQELERREQVYRDGWPAPDMAGRTIILVDDGIATGSTMRAAIAALRQLEPSRLIVAVPIAARPTARTIQTEVDELVAVLTPADFSAVGQWYEDFSQITDAEVCHLLKQARQSCFPA